MTRLELATAEYIGARAQQQDLSAAIPTPEGALLVLADGLGGHESGADAARIVVETFRAAASSGAFEPAASRRTALRETVERANQKIADGADPAHGHRGMASTVVAAVLAGDELSWVSVGDSHLYVWRDGRLDKLNEDHSQAGLMVRSGNFKASDPEVQAVKSVLVSALTGRKLEIVDLPQQSFRLAPGDVVLLASDGLNTLEDPEIEHIVGGVRGEGAVRLSTVLLETVRDRRAERQDNTTVAVARVLGEPEPETTAEASEPKTVAHEVSVPLMPDDEARTERVAIPASGELPAAPPRSAPAPSPAPSPVARGAPAELEPAMEQTFGASGERADASGGRPNLEQAHAPTERVAQASPRPAPPRLSPRVRRSDGPAEARAAAPGRSSQPRLEAPIRERQAHRGGSAVMRLLLVVIALLAVLGALIFMRPDFLERWLPRGALQGKVGQVTPGVGPATGNAAFAGGPAAGSGPRPPSQAEIAPALGGPRLPGRGN